MASILKKLYVLGPGRGASFPTSYIMLMWNIASRHRQALPTLQAARLQSSSVRELAVWLLWWGAKAELINTASACKILCRQNCRQLQNQLMW